MQEPSIFTRILRGNFFQEIIFEDDICFVILSNVPFSPGHSLIIPKQQISQLWELPDDTYRHVMSIAKEMATRITTAFNYARIGMTVDGFGVPEHAHFHVFGYIERGLEPTVICHVARKIVPTAEEFKAAADKLRS